MKKHTLFFLIMAMPLLGFSQQLYQFKYDIPSRKIISYATFSKDATGKFTQSVIKETLLQNGLSDIVFKKGDLVQVIIPEVNKYVYGITATIENQVFNTTPPKSLAGLTTDFDPSALLGGSGSKKNPVEGIGKGIPFSKKLINAIDMVNEEKAYFTYSNIGLNQKDLSVTLTTPGDTVVDIKKLTPQKVLLHYNKAVAAMRGVDSIYFNFAADTTLKGHDRTLFEQLYTGYKEQKYPALFETYLSQLINVSPDDFKFETAEVPVTGEKVNISISIKRILDEKLQPAAIALPTTVKYSALSKKFWHWSFSGGFFVSNLASKTYIAKPSTRTNNTISTPADTVTGYRNVIDDNPNTVIGAAVLLHHTYKFTPSFEAGFHAGLGTPINTTFKLNYLLGGSLLFFNDNRLGINFGLAAGYVQELSPNVSTETFYQASGALPISYVNKFKLTGLQASVTYNISSLFKTSSASSSETEKK